MSLPKLCASGQVQEEHVVGGRVVGQVVHDRDHRVVVAMANHAALRRAGRPGRVDERRGPPRRSPRRRRRGRPGASRNALPSSSSAGRSARETSGAPAGRHGGSRPWPVAGRPRRGRPLPRSAQGGSGRRGASCSRRCRRRWRRHARGRSPSRPTRASSATGSRRRRPSRSPREQAVRQELDAFSGIGPRDLAPRLALVDEVRRAGVPRHGVAPQPGNRPVAGHS